MQPIPCQRCGELAPPHDIVSYSNCAGDQRQWCAACVNQDVMQRMGVSGFQDVRFEPVPVIDARGVEHMFHFRVRLFGNLAIDAFELVDGAPGGYQFQIIDDAEADPWSLLARLIERIRRALRLAHLSEDRHGLHISDSCVRGRIESDMDRDPRMPVLVIDGREVSWEAVGRMLMSFEGWQFKLECFDRSAEV